MWAHLAGRQRRHRPLPRAAPASRDALGRRRPARRRDRRPRRRRAYRASSGCNRGCRPARPAAVRRGAADQPVVYMVFDVLWLDGHSTCELPYTERRALLERLALAGPVVADPAHHRTARGARRVLETSRAARARGRGRQAASTAPYLPGQAGRRVAQGEDHPRPGARGRRLAPGRGTARRAARFAARRLPRHAERRPRPAALRRPRRAPASTAPSASASSAAARRWRRADSPVRRRRRSCPKPQWVEPELVVEVGVPRVDEARACCARRATAGCATTSPRPTSCARPDRSQYRPAHDRRSRRARRHRAGGARARRRASRRASWSTPRSRASTR